LKPDRELKPLGLTEYDKLIFSSIAKELGQKRVIAVGSRVKGYWTESSDYDVLIVTTVTKALREKVKELEKKMNIKIDVSSGLHWQPNFGIYVEAE
jgi:predicted nucleotidyltransferase